MTTEVGAMQAAPECACELAVAPRARKRRGATKEKDPAASAAGNGQSVQTAQAVLEAAVAETEPATAPVRPAAARKPRRRYHRVVVGGDELEIGDGRIHRWVEKKDERHRPVQVRRTDEFGLPTSEWVETGRHLSDNRIMVEFPEGFELPLFIWLDGDKVRWFKPPTPKGTKPRSPIEWFPATDREKRLAFLAGLPNQDPATKPKLKPRPEPADEWFQVALPRVAMQNDYWDTGHEWENDRDIPPDARENFPEGWCCRLVRPQPEGGDLDWVYVQFPEPYTVHSSDGRAIYKTDRRGGRGGKVKCGMWVPRWILKPISLKEATRLWDIVKIYIIYGYVSLGEAEKYYEYLVANGHLTRFFRIVPKIRAIQEYYDISFNEAFYIFLGEASAPSSD